MNIRILDDVSHFLDRIAEHDTSKIFANLELLRQHRLEGLFIKSLRGKIQEMIVKQYRIIFFYHHEIVYIVDAFKKQSKKTPKRIIERAEDIYDFLENSS